MTDFNYDIGILGGGSAGLTIASGAARLGAKTLLLEKESLGGDCLYYGCVPSKTLIRTAQVYHDAKRAEVFGLPRVALPPVDYRAVVERIRSVIRTIEKEDSIERFCGMGAQVEIGDPCFVDEHTVKMNSRNFSARNWVIGTGSSPAIPPIPGLAETPHLSNRDIFSLDRLPSSLMVIGGGPIGVEMGQAFARLGSDVTIIQQSGQILDREDPDMAGLLQDILSAEGIKFCLNAEIRGIRDMGHAKEITLRVAGETSVLQGETILVAAGRTANLREMGLETIGIEFNQRGLKLDARLRTNMKHIYGAGDVTGAYQFTHAAGYEGSIVVSNAILHLPRKTDYTLLPWCTYTEPELASIGMNERRAREAGIRISSWVEDFHRNDRALAEGATVGRIKMILDEGERCIGVQILGSKAGELLGEWVAVLNGHVRLSRIASAVQPYPTLAEISKKVAGDLYARKLFSGTVQKGLKLLFGLKGRACGVE